MEELTIEDEVVFMSDFSDRGMVELMPVLVCIVLHISRMQNNSISLMQDTLLLHLHSIHTVLRFLSFTTPATTPTPVDSRCYAWRNKSSAPAMRRNEGTSTWLRWSISELSGTVEEEEEEEEEEE